MEDQEIEFKEVISFKKSHKILGRVAIVCIIFSFLFSAFVYYNSLMERNYVYIVDKETGDINTGKKVNEKEARLYEYENAIETVFTLWYQFDQYTYKKNQDKALLIFGNTGKRLLKEIPEGTEGSIKSENMVFTVNITERPMINMNQYPSTGTIKGIQTISIENNKIEYELSITYSIYNCDRSRENPHGVIIEDWIESIKKIEQ